MNTKVIFPILDGINEDLNISLSFPVYYVHLKKSKISGL